MRVLWLLNTPMPEALSALTGRPEVSRATGSWVCALAEALSGRSDLTLFTAAPSKLATKLMEIQGPTATHFVVPEKGNYWQEVYDRARPDVVHIHGSEYPFFLDFVNTCGNAHVVVSLQGLVSVLRDCYFGGIPEADVARTVSLRDRIRRDSLLSQKEDMGKRGEMEIRLLRSVRHIMGRSPWDRSVALEINPSLTYHRCNEALRGPFYSGSWKYASCVPHRIFVAQGHYPLKGLHYLLEALPAVLERFPDTSVRVAGPDILRGNGIIDRLLRPGYANYLVSRMRSLGLEDRVSYIGECDAGRMKKELLEANLYVLPSVLENTSNSLCEAQMLGVPVLASEVGGTPSLVPDASCGMLYPFDDAKALSERIIRSFEEAPAFDPAHMRAVAAGRHDRERIISDLLKVYVEVAD